MEHVSSLLRIKVLSGGIRAAGKSSGDNKEGRDYYLRGERAADKMTRIKIEQRKPDITYSKTLDFVKTLFFTAYGCLAMLPTPSDSHIFKNLCGAEFQIRSSYKPRSAQILHISSSLHTLKKV